MEKNWNRPFLKRGAIIALSGLIAGCANLTSTDDPASVPHGSKPPTSTFYYLPKGILQISGAVGADKRFAITITEVLEPEIDRKPFYLHYSSSIFVSDYYQAQVNPKGLLESVVFMDTNLGWGSGSQGALPSQTISFENTKEMAPFTQLIDPFDRRAVENFNNHTGNPFHLHLHIPPPVEPPTRSHKEKGMTYAGIAFHPMIPVEVGFRAGDGEQHVVIPVPDQRVTLAFNTDRGLFDERGLQIEFMDGMLTTVQISHQSIMTVILGVPKTLIEDVLPVPPGW